jgi:hypothetical protein
MTRVIKVSLNGDVYTIMIERSKETGKFGATVYLTEDTMMRKTWESTTSYVTITSVAGAAMESIAQTIQE